MLFDIDHFKRINDTYGHSAGDEVLRQVARMCAGLMRPADLFARWGGEGFIHLLPTRDMNAALQIAEWLHRGIAGMTVRSGTARIRLIASFGLAVADGRSSSLDELVGRADRAMYRAKQTGRNRTEAAAAHPSGAVAARH